MNAEFCFEIILCLVLECLMRGLCLYHFGGLVQTVWHCKILRGSPGNNTFVFVTVISVMGTVYTLCIHRFDVRIIADLCFKFLCKLLKLLVNTSPILLFYPSHFDS